MGLSRFNQDATCFVTSSEGNSVTIYNCDPFGKCFEMVDEDTQNIGDDDARGDDNSGGDDDLLVEMLFSTNLVAIVHRKQGILKSKKLKIVNIKRKTIICELSFPHPIQDVVMNRKRVCVLLNSDQIHIYDISCMKHLHTIDIWDSQVKSITGQGVDSLSNSGTSNMTSLRERSSTFSKSISPKICLSNDDRSILAFNCYSTSSKSVILNDVVIFDALNISPLNYINSVHKGNVASLAISPDGKFIATASEKGTLVRIFNTGAETESELLTPLLYEFRRGNRPCNINQLTFNSDSTLLGCVGDSDTIHIFKLDSTSRLLSMSVNSEDNSHITSEDIKALRKDPNSKQFTKLISKTIKKSIPSQALRRDFAHITIKNTKTKHILGFPKEFMNQVYVLSNDGSFFIYSLPSTSGSCVLSKQNDFK
ncbi:hypothetical protein Kpol_242p8 [Vanderwaltozyma polyspora DSM 70294]|uniref:Autophagy-related protein 21 n=1 Tax=Vanderwaltozyma polyspora (strain ATCC 22028 / DSM 70294 / BCRC 21397 / CBS 2163 / NBRC 10782 / NRRL Y-8283 / UCD 57-17) TaxID=436907 RepID=ATG21_VANPO|nr:uncharacterized protein Kpol_242p8 [Vanderwaltozyma polyspora DSM 70294]A7TTC8.1 RecName: Full=Autophagy-related protein 21 [Vanderwaltozyma polyspora DSM 70294]EDO14485.1 hypothetical protein Kpol_242p8 [Vanderwaltozyma polyspora DSM 70294]